MKTVAILGFGSRGQLFAKLIDQDETVKLVAVAEPQKTSRDLAISKYGVPEAMCFESAEQFLSREKMCDALFLCTQDKQHYAHMMKALELGYDVCLEKPAAVTIEQCEQIRDRANELGRKVMLTHVLRYSPFYQTVKRLILDGKLGEVVTINQTENIAYWHFGLSYVRGQWRNTEQSCPAIIAKCCHDLDIISWLMNDKCTAVSSFGGLYHFRESNAPAGSTEYCVDCPEKVKKDCLYNAFDIYPQRVVKSVVGGMSLKDPEKALELLKSREHIWGRCVYRCDNDVADHQVVNMEFRGGQTAHLTMTAFSERCYRFIKVHGTRGEVYGDLEEGKLYFTPYGKPLEIIDIEKIAAADTKDGHGGGDAFLYKDFIDYINGKEKSFTRTDIDASIESHIIGFSAETSRLHGGKVITL